MALQLIRKDETSNYYRNADFPHLKFVERTDAFSIDDIIFPDQIPHKGIVLNQMSNSWMKLLEKAGIIQNPIVASSATSLSKLGVDEDFSGRMIAVQECIPIPLECIVRGYYVEESKSWDPYREHCNMYGNVLPRGLKDSQRLPHPIYTPSTKGDVNKPDLNISFAESIEIVRQYLIDNMDLTADEQRSSYAIAFSVAEAIRNASVNAYIFAHEYAFHRNIIIADAKLEFGTVVDTFTGKRKLVIISEAFTPDTCRFWSSKNYQIGRPQPSLDKHIIKRYVRRNLKWNRFVDAPPTLPSELLSEASEVYWDMYKQLFDKDFVGVTSELAWNWKFAQQNVLL